MHFSVSIVSCQTVLFHSHHQTLCWLFLVAACLPPCVWFSYTFPVLCQFQAFFFGKSAFSLVCWEIVQLLYSLSFGILWWIPAHQSFNWLLMDLIHHWILLDHFHDLEVVHSPPLVRVLSQYFYLTLQLVHVSLLTVVLEFAPQYLVEFFHLPVLWCSFCNVLDAMHIWCLFSKFSYFTHIASSRIASFFYFSLFMTVCHIFACDCMLHHTSWDVAID